MRALTPLQFIVGSVIAVIALPAFAADPDPGIWGGAWEGKMTTSQRPHTLVLSDVTNGKAKVVYTWGSAPNDRAPNTGSIQADGNFPDERMLVIEFPQPVGTVDILTRLTFTLKDDGTLAVESRWTNQPGGLPGKGVLRKK
jgi:hypothetical protein